MQAANNLSTIIGFLKKRSLYMLFCLSACVGYLPKLSAQEQDSLSPDLQLFGGSEVPHKLNKLWLEPGYEASDVRDGNLTSSVSVSGTVDVNTTGTYTLTYTVSDAAGNEANATRTIHVAEILDFRGLDISDMKWRGSDLSSSLFDESVIFSNGTSGVDLSSTGANLSDLNLSGVNFTGSNLSGVNLKDSNLSVASLAQVSLGGANLNGTDLLLTNLDNTSLVGAMYNSFTIWPAGFSPEEVGALRSDQAFLDYLSEFEDNASRDGNLSGVEAVLANHTLYELFKVEDYGLVSKDVEKESYNLGYTAGSERAYSEILSNPNAYDLFTEADLEESKVYGAAVRLAKIQTEFALEGLSLVLYMEDLLETNSTQTSDWYYQPSLGWMWANRNSYPYLYNLFNQGSEAELNKWFYFNKFWLDQDIFYDFSVEDWFSPFL